MKLFFQPRRLEKEFGNHTRLVRSYGTKIASSLEMLLGLLEDATSLYDVYAMPQYMMELLKGNRSGTYSLTLDKKKSKWRFLVTALNENLEPVKPGENEVNFLKGVEAVLIKGLSEHYDD